ncbi:hypothetical protein J6590_029508 [Homalodisca vitripennis]|nr:hypothetical protein J6590_029508 [Homalodisca vitripennis]
MVPCVDIVEITAHLCWYVPETQLANGTVCRHCGDNSSSLLVGTRHSCSTWYREQVAYGGLASGDAPPSPARQLVCQHATATS